MKKKIHYARALAQNSKIFIIDDPFGYLDNQGVEIVQKLIESLIVVFCSSAVVLFVFAVVLKEKE